jgi:hypothetical protein
MDGGEECAGLVCGMYCTRASTCMDKNENEN